MKILFCDICGSEMTASSTGAIAGGALADLTGSEHICAKCASTAMSIDWKNVLRDFWREAVLDDLSEMREQSNALR